MKHLLEITLFGALTVSCQLQRPDNARSPVSSDMKTVTIKHPNFRETMTKDLTPEMATKADELVKKLVVKASSKAMNCDSGVLSENKDLGERSISENAAHSNYSFRKGCDYTIKLVYADSSNQSAVLVSDESKINLTKAELEVVSPIAKVTLFATTEGQKFWPNVPLLDTAPTSNKILTEKENAGVVKVVAGQTIVIRLIGKNDAGYQWSFVSSKLGTPTMVIEPPTSTAIGASPTYVFTWKTSGLASGDYAIELENKRPFGNDPAELFNVKITLE